MPFAELGKMLLQAIPYALRRADYLLVIGVVVLLVHLQYERTAAMERRMFGTAKTSPLHETAMAIVLGVLGGAVGTALFVFLGISLSGTGIGLMWLLSILMMMVHPRFLCFSYSGGILALSSLLFGWPEVHVPSIMALVAALHLVEALLIWISGAISATPLYIKHADGRVVGGFTLQKAWPIPFVALIGGVVASDLLAGADLLAMPDWWPLIRPDVQLAPGHEMLYTLFPVVAALGYGDFTVTRSPQAKARRSALGLVGFSLGLMALALLATRQPGWAWAAAVFSPGAHELLIQWGRRQEERGRPVFTAEDGAMVLDVVPDGPGEQMGLRPGDVILAANGRPVANRADLEEALRPWCFELELEVENRLFSPPRRRSVRYRSRTPLPPMGILLAPAPDEPRYVQFRGMGPMGRMMQRVWRRVLAAVRQA